MTSQFNFIKPLLRGWIIIVVAMAGAYMLASKYLSYVTPMYESTAKLRLADLHEGVSNSNLFKDFDVFASTQKIQADIELIMSHAIIKKALDKVPFETILVRQGSLKNTELFNDAPVQVTRLHLESRYLDQPFHLQVKDKRHIIITDPFGKVCTAGMEDTVRFGGTTLRVSLNNDLILQKPDINITDHFIVTFLSTEKQISEVLSHLDVTAVDKDVPVIRISYKSSHPEKAALFPNALAQAYIEDYIETKFGAANVTSDFLDERIREISSKLTGTESAILNYREKNDITNIRQETETDLKKISEMKIQQTNLKMSVEAVRQLDTYMENGKDNFLDLAPNFEAFTDLLSTEMIKKIKDLQAEKKDLLLEYTPKDERVRLIDSKIEDLSSYLRESIRNTRNNLQSKYDNLAHDITEAEKVFITVPENERVMTILNREFEIYQQSYNFLNQKKIEAEIAKAAKVAFHRVITPAGISKTPVSPNRTIIKGVSVILGMLTVIMLIYIVHNLKARVNDISTVESSSMIPVIAAVPKLKKQAEIENFFLTTVTQWQVKGLFQPRGISCFTGFDTTHGLKFITTETARQLYKQGRKLLIIEVVDENTGTDFWRLKSFEGQSSQLLLSRDAMKYQMTETIQSVIRNCSADFDQTILINTNFGEAYTLAMMAMADLNLVCLDTRLTPAKKIVEVDLIKTEYQLPQVFFVVNRVGYNPGFIREMFRTIINLWSWTIKKIKR
jgi:uncharacterized protein involved in exopolysaccharide biosynthesis